jgi:membrane-bound serine protease (ClpP class)
MSRNGQMGACALIMIGPGGGVESMSDTVQSKIESPIKATFTDASQRRGYDPLLCDAMVTIGTEIYWVENTESGERKFVTTEQKARLLREGGRESVLGDLAKRLAQGESGQWRLVETFADAETGTPRSVRQPVVKSDELLTLNANQAVAYGFARAVVNSPDELGKCYGLPGPSSVTVIDFDWAETLTAWLTSPTVRGVLMMLLMMGAYMEFKTPGLGAGGAVALVALVLLLGAPYMTGLAGTWEVSAVIIGVVLMIAEIFIIPGFGVAGILGVLFVVAGLLGTFVPAEPGPFHWPQLDAPWEALRRGVLTLIGGTLASLFGVWGLARYLPRMPVTNQMFLGTETAREQHLEAGAPVVADAPVWVGARGVSQTVLRPAGKALIDGQRFDVVTEGDMIDSGVEVQVVRVEGNRVVVRAVTDATEQTT